MNIIHEELQKLPMAKIKDSRILLMGRIEHLVSIKQWLSDHGGSVAGILDNDQKKTGMSVENIRVDLPGNFLQPFDPLSAIIIYSPKYWEDMLEQVKSYGYKDGRQIFVLDRPGEKKNRHLVHSGYQIYKQLQREYGKDTMIFMANCPLGDYYLLGLFFHQYCRANHIDRYVVVGESAGIDKLSGLLGIRHTERLDTQACNALIRAWIFLGEKKVHMKPLTIWQGAFRFNSCLTRQQEGFTFMDTFKKMIYHLPDEVQPAFPEVAVDRNKIQQIFQDHQLQPGKTVLLSPFAYSLQTLPMSFWEKLARELTDIGYCVAVNVGDKRECNSLPDTVTLKLDFVSIMGVMEYAGTVIGIRSGFFDITSQAECRRIILYPKRVEQNVPWNSTDIEFCSLKNMGLCMDAMELEVQSEEDLLQQILSAL